MRFGLAPRGVTLRGPHERVPFTSRLLLGIVATCIGCMPVHTSTSTSRRVLEAHDQDQQLPGEWVRARLQPGSGLAAGGDVLKLELAISSYRRCERVRTELVEVTTETRNEMTNSDLVQMSYIVGVAGAVILGLSIADLAYDDPNNPAETKNDGGAINGLLWGGLATAALVPAIVTSFRAIDDESVDEVEEVHRTSRRCDETPLANSPVALKADGEWVATQKTDRVGRVSFSLHRNELVTSPGAFSVEVAGHALGDSPKLAGLFERVVSAWRSQEPSRGPEVFGVPLASAGLDEFERAAVASGCALEHRENYNVAYYDGSCAKLSGYERMKVVSDGHRRLVKLEFSGETSSQDEQRLIAALTAKYGEPSPEPETDSTLSWDVGGGIRLTLERGASSKSVAYIHLARRAELKEALERKEQQEEP